MEHETHMPSMQNYWQRSLFEKWTFQLSKLFLKIVQVLAGKATMNSDFGPVEDISNESTGLNLLDRYSYFVICEIKMIVNED